MGVMLVILAFIIVLIVLVSLLVCLCRKSPKFLNIVRKIRAKIFWNSILRYILQSYLKSTIACLFAISLISFVNKNAIINAILSIVILSILVVLPIVFAAILQRHRVNL